MDEKLSRRAANIADLKRLARSRLPGFAYEFIAGGCNDNQAVSNNRASLNRVYLDPHNLKTPKPVDLHTTIFDQQYASPFGIAPVGLSGIVWPRASQIHARAAHDRNIPFVLSSVSTTSIEQAAKYAKDNFWFQIYPPKDLSMRLDIMRRAREAGCKNLVVTIDVPSLSWRPADIKNGLAVPPKISFKNLMQTIAHPVWAAATAKTGIPQFETLKPYIDKNLDVKQTAQNVRHVLREVVNTDVLKSIREHWPGNLIVKGVLNLKDVERAVDCGAQGVIVSNHGGRQLDAAVSPVQVLPEIVQAYKDKITIMADSGVESGIDIARYLACGAEMVFAGRAFMYGVGALGHAEGGHTIDILNAELKQLLEQLRCQTPARLSEHHVMQTGDRASELG